MTPERPRPSPLAEAAGLAVELAQAKERIRQLEAERDDALELVALYSQERQRAREWAARWKRTAKWNREVYHVARLQVARWRIKNQALMEQSAALRAEVEARKAEW